MITVNDSNEFASDLITEPERPDFLKILCIFSFINSGIMIFLFGIGSFCLGVDQNMIDSFWDKVLESNPKLENVNPLLFFNELGWLCLFSFFSNITSLVGVIMMWRLEKIGFFIYASAEIITNFFNLGLNIGEEFKSYSNIIVSISIDLIFIFMYFLNLKYMHNKKQKINS